MSNVDTDWLETLIEQVRTTQPAYSRYFQNELDQIFKRVHGATGGNSRGGGESHGRSITEQ